MAEGRILCLGDSYTFGEAVDPADRWPAQLARGLRRAGQTLAEPMVLAVTGWTTWELDEAISLARLAPPYDFVTLLIGVNDQYRGYDAAHYEPRFDGLLQQAIDFADGLPERVAVISIPDYSVTPFAATLDTESIRTTLAEFNAVNRRLTTAAGAHYIDITPHSRTAASDRTLIADDGLHPSEKMYAEWTRQLSPVVIGAFAD